MFLGYSVVQLPGFFLVLFECAKSRLQISKNIEGNENRGPDYSTKQVKQRIPSEFGYNIP